MDLSLQNILSEVLQQQSLDELLGKYKEETVVLYKDKNMVCLMPKSQMTSYLYSHKTNWCSRGESGFRMWSSAGLLLRFLFKTGKKIRLTYEFEGKFNWANESGWHKLENTGNPFTNYNPPMKTDTDGIDIVNYIKLIPEECRTEVLKFIENNNKRYNYCKREGDYESPKYSKIKRDLADLRKKYYQPIKTKAYDTNHEFQMDISFSETKRKFKLEHSFSYGKNHNYVLDREYFDNVNSISDRIEELLKM